jgi:hypothetical protein
MVQAYRFQGDAKDKRQTMRVFGTRPAGCNVTEVHHDSESTLTNIQFDAQRMHTSAVAADLTGVVDRNSPVQMAQCIVRCLRTDDA